ncbi:GAL7 [Candida pseudojiufengensis]|uniref:GAL7 n=1 Tax=Candida pseudojiufengensis TaxID=497109 RepID=UPI002225A5F2|nr:GAL7 [Candida pseudojiufengensis]KAI5959574.1 GAL7 [Candida pseudojiufengensis]
MSIQNLLNPITSTPTYIKMSQQFDFTNHSHRRYNPLTNRFVLCSPHRAKRPWQGAKEEIKKTQLPDYDPKCYLCPGNIRATGDVNPKYESTYIFPNDYPAVKLDQPDYNDEEGETNPLKRKLFKTEGVKGKCFVICFSPKHNLTIPIMSLPEIENVVNTWQNLYVELLQDSITKKAPYKYLQIFENKGFAMGCSNPHPHGQAWCLDIIPTEVQDEITNMNQYHKENNSHLLGDYAKLELEEKQRIVLENDSFIVVVPYWALWPFETLLVSKQHLKSIHEFNSKQKQDLASILKRLTTKYDNLFNTSFPYSMGIHQAPFSSDYSEEYECSWFHIHFYPPLLRSATVKKFCVGFEMLGEAQRDLTSEQAASRLQDLDSDVHYTSLIE